MTESHPQKKQIFIYLMIISMIIWGGSWASAKILSSYLPPFQLTFLRFFISTIFFIPLIISHPISLKLKDLIFILIGSLSMGLYFLLFFKGLEKGYANMAGVFVTSLIPVFTMLLSKIFMKQKFRGIDYLGIFIGLVGGLIIMKIWNINMEKLVTSGNIYFLLCPLLWAILTICSEKTGKHISSVTFSFFCHLFCTLIFLPTIDKNLLKIFSLDWTFWTNILYLSVISSVIATTIFFHATTKLNSYKTSAFTFIVPVSSLVISMIFLSEKPELTTLTGGLFSIIATFLISL